MCRPWAQPKPLSTTSSHPKALAQAKKAPLGEHVNYEPEEIVYVSSGDGATSEGEFWESLNAACAKKLPMFYLVEDNGYAISVPIEVQTAGGSISKLVQGSPACMSRNATAPIRWKATRSARKPSNMFATARSGAGPCPCHAALFALAFRRRKTLQDRRGTRRRSAPRSLSKFSLFLIREGLMDQKEIEALEAEVDREVREATDQALAAETTRRRLDSH